MGVNGRYLGTPRWVKEYGRWVRRVPERALAWCRTNGLIPVENAAPRAGGTEDGGPPGIAKPAMSRTRPRRAQ